MFEDELEGALLALRQIRERLDQRNPQDDREKLLRKKIELIETVGIDIPDDEERPAIPVLRSIPLYFEQ